jgi:hypothetical protein
METLLEFGEAYSELGFSVIAVDSGKRSIGSWAAYQDRVPSPADLRRMFSHPRAAGLAIVCGKGSGGLEVIDIDLKYDLTGTLYEDLGKTIRRSKPGLFENLVIAVTRSGGRHMLYRSTNIPGNSVLARRPATEAELTLKPADKIKVLIETRGQAGYILAPPSAGYRIIQGNYDSIPVISSSDRETLMACAREFNKYTLERKRTIRPVQTIRLPGLSPLDDYNRRGDVVALLERHGWKIVEQTPEKTTFKRPGDTDKDSSGDYNYDLGLFSTFSSSTIFEPEKGYRPYAVYAFLECNGDFRKATRQLALAGFGDPLKPRVMDSPAVKKHL